MKSVLGGVVLLCCSPGFADVMGIETMAFYCQKHCFSAGTKIFHLCKFGGTFVISSSQNSIILNTKIS